MNEPDEADNIVTWWEFELIDPTDEERKLMAADIRALCARQAEQAARAMLDCNMATLRAAAKEWRESAPAHEGNLYGERELRLRHSTLLENMANNLALPLPSGGGECAECGFPKECHTDKPVDAHKFVPSGGGDVAELVAALERLVPNCGVCDGTGQHGWIGEPGNIDDCQTCAAARAALTKYKGGQP